MTEIMRKALAIQERLYAAIEEDAASFNAVLEAFRLPNREEKESLHRSKMIEKAYRNATVPPQKVSKLSLQLLELSGNLLRRGNPNAYSDAGVAAYLAYAAISGGLLNIQINLSSVKDKVFRQEKEKLSRDLSRKRDRWMKAVQKNMEPKNISKDD